MNDLDEHVVLVNDRDETLGTMGKLEAHRRGVLHRAFSIFLFDAQGRLLMQRRADDKYHSAGLWTNTCCGHPREGEDPWQAARRRLMEEMGIDAELRRAFRFTYRAEVSNDLIEHEVDDVYFGSYSDAPVPDPREVGAWSYVEPDRVTADLRERPALYTAWLHQCWPEVVGRIGTLERP